MLFGAINVLFQFHHWTEYWTECVSDGYCLITYILEARSFAPRQLEHRIIGGVTLTRSKLNSVAPTCLWCIYYGIYIYNSFTSISYSCNLWFLKLQTDPPPHCQWYDIVSYRSSFLWIIILILAPKYMNTFNLFKWWRCSSSSPYSSTWLYYFAIIACYDRFCPPTHHCGYCFATSITERSKEFFFQQIRTQRCVYCSTSPNWFRSFSSPSW